MKTYQLLIIHKIFESLEGQRFGVIGVSRKVQKEEHNYLCLDLFFRKKCSQLLFKTANL